MAAHDPDLVEPDAGQSQKVMMHRMEMLGHDVQTGMRQQVVHIGDPAGHRVLDRNHGQPGAAVPDRSQRLLEVATRQGRPIGMDLPAGEIGIGAERALEGNRVEGQFGQSPASILRAVSRSSGVSTPSGTVSTSAASIRMPASSARSCSSRSRCSSAPGGSATKRSRAARRKA